MADFVYPYKKYNYRLTIENIDVAAFSEVSGFDASIEVIEYREGNMPTNSPRKLPGLTKYGNVTLKWGMTENREFYDWVATISDGTQEERMRTVEIYLLDDAHTELASWTLTNAWPCKYTAPDFNATSSEIAFESVELAFEEMRRES